MREQSKETIMLLKLMKAALNQHPSEKIYWSDKCSEEKLAEMIVRQCLVSLVYPVIEKQEEIPWKNIKGKLEKKYHQEIHKAFTQEYEISNLLDAMEQEGIDCLPMKGWIMRNYYPDPVMRSMCDFDVLLKDFDSRRLQTWMEGQGYFLEKPDDVFHDIYLKPPYMVVELHRNLVDKRYLTEQEKEHADKWMETLWQRSLLTDGKRHTYYLRDEDFLIHHLIHMYKHFTTKGCGIRPLADIYVFLQKKEKVLDQDYLKKELKLLNLLEFAQRMAAISKACFEGEKMDEESILVAEFLIDGGIYGSREHTETIRLLGRTDGTFAGNKLSAAVKRIFPSAKELEVRYPRLKTSPWMLPLYWIMRIGRILFRERNRIELVREAQTKEQYENMRDIFRAAGIIRKG